MLSKISHLLRLCFVAIVVFSGFAGKSFALGNSGMMKDLKAITILNGILKESQILIQSSNVNFKESDDLQKESENFMQKFFSPDFEEGNTENEFSFLESALGNISQDELSKEGNEIKEKWNNIINSLTLRLQELHTLQTKLKTVIASPGIDERIVQSKDEATKKLENFEETLTSTITKLTREKNGFMLVVGGLGIAKELVEL